MADKTPIRLVFDGSTPTGIAEYQTGDTIANEFLSNSSFTLVDDSSTSTTISLGESMKIGGDTGITTSISGDNISIDLDDTAVTPGSYGSATSIPTFTVDQQGRLTAAGSANVATDLTIVDDSSSSATISLLTDTLKIGGTSNEIETSISGDTVTIGLPNDVTIGNDLSVTNDLTVTGNLTVNGTTTTVNSSTIEITNSFTFEGSTADAFETVLGVIDPTSDRSINLPNASGTIVLQDTTDTLTNKTLTNPTINAATFTGDVNFDSETLFIDESTDRVGVGSSTLYQPLTVHNTSSAQLHLRTANPAIRFSSDVAGNSEATRGFIGFATNSGAFITGSQVGDLVMRGKSQGSIILGDSSSRYATFSDGGNLFLGGSLTFEGSTDDAYETTLDVTDPTADRTITLPNATGTVVLADTTDTLTNKTIDGDNNTITNIGPSELSNTAVTAGSYGSATEIPTFTVDQQGRLTAAGTASVATNLTIVDDSSTSATISLLSDTLKIAGTSNEIETSISGDSLIVGLPNDVTVGNDLTVTNDLQVNGATTLTGNVTLGNASSDTITATGRFGSALVPDTNITYDLGTSSLRWRDIYLSGNTIDLNGATISADGTGVLSISASGATLPAGSKVNNSLISITGDDGVAERLVSFFTNSGGLSSAAATFTFKSDIERKFTAFTLGNGDDIGNPVQLFTF